MNQLTLVFLGAGTGGALRYLLAHGLNYVTGHHFPYGTILVNVSGCFFAGLLSLIIMPSDVTLIALIMSGFLGGYTTFSSFTFETGQLIEKGNFLAAFFNVALSLLLCMSAVAGGVYLGGFMHLSLLTN